MERRMLGKTGLVVSEVGFGAWAIGGEWGTVPREQAVSTVEGALDAGMTFVDTADVYGDGRSEEIVAQVRRHRTDPFVIATKAGRRLDPHSANGYTLANIEAFVDRSRDYLETDTIDLLQLHCPPTPVFENSALFEALGELQARGKVAHLGVSVETIEEAERAIRHPIVSTVQIVFNMFRPRPRERFFPMAAEKGVGIIARVPLASGLLSGKMRSDMKFENSDHRRYNRQGEAFDVGETFSGVDFEEGLEAVEELREITPSGMTMAQFALKWVLMHPEVSVVIPGAKTPAQARENAAVSDLPALPDDVMMHVDKIYQKRIRPSVHHRW
jgi:aryl-alcohol dehydrogenase-like predicted oxidoreductase